MQAAIDTLNRYDQWVVWCYEDRGGPKPTKPPYDPKTGKKASTADPATWATWQAATEMSRQGYEGVGFVLTNDDPLTALDLDGCLDPDLGLSLHPRVEDIIELFDSYTEVSPSGTGIRIILKGEWPVHLKHKIQGEWGDNFEIYSSERYVTLTGNSYHSPPRSIRDGQSGLDELMPLFTGRDVSAHRAQDARDKHLRAESDAIAAPGHLGTLDEDIRALLAQDWSHDRSSGIITVASRLKHRGYRMEAAYEICRKNRDFCKKMDDRSRSSRGMGYFGQHVWHRIYTGGESEGENAFLRDLAVCFERYSPELSDFYRDALALQCRLAQRHGSATKAGTTYKILNIHKPGIGSQQEYSVWLNRGWVENYPKGHPNYVVQLKGFKGQATVVNLDTPVNRRKVETYRRHRDSGHHEPSRRRRGADHPTTPVVPRKPSNADRFRALCRDHRPAKRTLWEPDEDGDICPDYHLIRHLGRQIDALLPASAIRSSSWKADDYRMAYHGYVRKARTKNHYVEIVLPDPEKLRRVHTPVVRRIPVVPPTRSIKVEPNIAPQTPPTAPSPTRGPPDVKAGLENRLRRLQELKVRWSKTD